jgi:hypothetical protein
VFDADCLLDAIHRFLVPEPVEWRIKQSLLACLPEKQVLAVFATISSILDIQNKGREEVEEDLIKNLREDKKALQHTFSMNPNGAVGGLRKKKRTKGSKAKKVTSSTVQDPVEVQRKSISVSGNLDLGLGGSTSGSGSEMSVVMETGKPKKKKRNKKSKKSTMSSRTEESEAANLRRTNTSLKHKVT